MLGVILYCALGIAILGTIAFPVISWLRSDEIWEILFGVCAVISFILLFVCAGYDTCPRCQEQHSGRYCTECGYDKHSIGKCPNCGEAFADDEYCANCGAHLKEEVNEK